LVNCFVYFERQGNPVDSLKKLDFLMLCPMRKQLPSVTHQIETYSNLGSTNHVLVESFQIPGR
jgi:hypothetical protein